MKFALVNPDWNFEGSIYFGCREPHLPLEYGYSKALLESAGHQVALIDGLIENLELGEIREQVRSFRPDITVITTAPSYLFWRCAPPELRAPQEVAEAIRDLAGRLVVVGPHASTTPLSTLRKIGAHAAVQGECEEILPMLAESSWDKVPSLAWQQGGEFRVASGTHASDMTMLPALRWPDASIQAHRHHHHRFEETPSTPGAEMEVSRGCPYHCTFCAKDNFRDAYRRRPLPVILEELDGLIAQGVSYVYFIDEIFLPWEELLEAVVVRNVKFGVQTRIDLWNERRLDLLGKAGCVSVEAGIESITETGRSLLDKRCKLSTAELADRLLYAKRRIPFVQANLIEMKEDNPKDVEAFRQQLINNGVWANQPVPLFPYPGSPDYTIRWGQPDERAWERAHEYYLGLYDEFSDVQEARPVPLVQPEHNVPV